MKKEELEKLINNPVKALIENHLKWSGSDKTMPSRDMNGLRGFFTTACIEERYTEDEWELMNKNEQDEIFAYWNSKFDDAAAEADRKWEAVKVILDL